MTRGEPEAVGEAPRDRRQREHPERVRGEDEAHRRQAMAVVDEVDGRHRHDEDHDHLADDERHERHQHGRPAEDRPRGGRRRRIVGEGGERLRIGEDVGLRTEQHGAQQQGEHEEPDRQRVRPGEGRQPERRRHVARRRDEVRAGDGADRRPPHHGPDRGRPTLGRDEVGGHVPSQVADPVRHAGECRRDEEQDDRAGDDRTDRDHGPDRAHRETEEEPGAPADAEHERREHGRGGGRADGGGGGGDAAEGGVTADVGGDQRADGDGGDVAGAAEGRDREQGPRHPSPHAREPGGIDAGGLGSGTDDRRCRQPSTKRSRNWRRKSPLARCSAAASRPIQR